LPAIVLTLTESEALRKFKEDKRAPKVINAAASRFLILVRYQEI